MTQTMIYRKQNLISSELSTVSGSLQSLNPPKRKRGRPRKEIPISAYAIDQSRSLNEATFRRGEMVTLEEFESLSLRVDMPVIEEVPKKKKRRRQIDPATCERDYSKDEIEFMNALSEYKRHSGRMFPTCSEILEVVRKLGYEKLEDIDE